MFLGYYNKRWHMALCKDIEFFSYFMKFSNYVILKIRFKCDKSVQ